MSRIAIFPSYSNLKMRIPYRECENRWICASDFIKWILCVENLGAPIAKEPIPELYRFYSTQASEDDDWMNDANRYIYYVSYVVEMCRYEILRAIERDEQTVSVNEGGSSRASRRLCLDTIEVFRNGRWVSVMLDDRYQDEETSEVDDEAYMKVIGYGLS